MKTIVISIPPGTHTRDLLKSGIVNNLLKKDNQLKIVILTAFFQDREFYNTFSNERISFEPLKEVKLKMFGRRTYWMLAKPYVKKIVNKSRFMKLINRKILSSILPCDYYRSIFKKYKPVLVIVPTAHKLYNVPNVVQANRMKIPVIDIVASWDNFNYTMGDYPQKLIVWNEMMFEEAVKKHNFNPEDIKVVGAPHCDFCFDDRYNETKEEFFKNLRFDTDKKLLTVATAPYRSVGDHTYILDILLEVIRKKSFIYPVQILCRLHPNDTFDRYKKYGDNDHITFYIPNKNYDLSGWKTDEVGVRCLISTLKYSDVLINIASTVTIEACFFDTPVINMAFSAYEQERFKERILVAHHQRHYKYLLNFNGIKLAHNEKQFINYINEYLKNPEVDRNGRTRIKEVMLNNTDGKSSERVADYILSLT